MQGAALSGADRSTCLTDRSLRRAAYFLGVCIALIAGACARHGDSHGDSGWSTCDTGNQVSMPGRQQRSSARILPSAK